MALYWWCGGLQKTDAFFSSKHTRYIKNVKVIKFEANIAQPAKIDLNKKSFPKQKTIQKFTIYAQGFRKTKNENPPKWEMGVTS